MAWYADHFLSRSRILVVMPHPDDETFACGGTIAREGAGRPGVCDDYVYRGPETLP